MSHLILREGWSQVLIFCRTKHGSNRLVRDLGKEGIAAVAIHGNKSQAQRTRALADFKCGKADILVATDIAARGIDIVELPHVVNYDLPHVPEYYVHRIGRTGRAGSAGEAVSLVCADEAKQLRDIERLIKRELKREEIEGFEPEHRLPAPSRTLGAGRQSKAPRSGGQVEHLPQGKTRGNRRAGRGRRPNGRGNLSRLAG